MSTNDPKGKRASYERAHRYEAAEERNSFRRDDSRSSHEEEASAFFKDRRPRTDRPRIGRYERNDRDDRRPRAEADEPRRHSYNPNFTRDNRRVDARRNEDRLVLSGVSIVRAEGRIRVGNVLVGTTIGRLPRGKIVVAVMLVGMRSLKIAHEKADIVVNPVGRGLVGAPLTAKMPGKGGNAMESRGKAKDVMAATTKRIGNGASRPMTRIIILVLNRLNRPERSV